MKTRLNLLAAGMLLAALGIGYGQSTIQFSAATYTVAESAGAVTLTVQRTNDTTTLVSVDYATADGTATNGLKYTATNGTLAFAAGQTNQSIVVSILNNGIVEGTKTFKVFLSNPTNAVLGTPTTNTVSITDNDVGIDFQFASYNAANGWAWAEDVGTVLIGVVRGDDGTLPVTVDVGTSDLTAAYGLDYVGFTNTLAFAPQERFKFVPIPILNDSVKETANKTLRVTLSNPTGGTLGSTKTTTVTIMDNDQGFQFATNRYDLSEDAGAAQLRVLRGTDDTNSTFIVDYATAEVSATSGVDYTGTTNKLSFAPGEKVKVISVPILNDGVKEATKYFRVTLSGPTGGGVLGSPVSTYVYIQDNDPGVGFELNSYSVWENAGTLTVTVLRGNDAALAPFTVDYATSNLTAVAGTDYQTVVGRLDFGQNETIKTITIPILRNAAVTNDTTFKVSLNSPTGGAALGTASTTVTIVNATEAGKFRPVAPPFNTALTIQSVGGLNTISWTGGGLLQRADRPTGPWQTLTNARSLTTVQSPLPTTFYRVTRPRPANVYVPSSYDGHTSLPLVMLVHGYGMSGDDLEIWVHFQLLAEARGFLYCHPEGTTDRAGSDFWNGTDAAADFWSTGVDDAGYLRGLIEEIGRHFTVDRKRIYLIGHSNGAFMCYQMACQSADLVAGIAGWAGGTFIDPSRCTPSGPVNVLEIHGTGDANVPYAGGAVTPAIGCPGYLPAFPGALQNVQTWAGYNGSSGSVADAAPSLDLTTDVAGLDTVVTRYTNCPPGGAVELWTILGATHNMNLSSQFSSLVIEWLLAHPKP